MQQPTTWQLGPAKGKQSRRLGRENRWMKNCKVLKADAHGNLIMDSAIKDCSGDADSEDFEGFDHYRAWPQRLSLAGRGVVGFEGRELFFPGERGGLQEADAAVPTEDGVVVACGADFFGFGEAVHRAFE